MYVIHGVMESLIVSELTFCLLAAINKAIHALQTAQSKDSGPATKKKKVSVAYLAKVKDKSEKDRPPLLQPPKANNSHTIVYKAKEGNQPIHKYGLKLISLVCNQLDPITAHRILDNPTPEFTLDNEPEKQRLMRLQVRVHGQIFGIY